MVSRRFIPDRAYFSRGILAFSWHLKRAMSDREFSGNTVFSRLFRLHCEITFGNLLSHLGADGPPAAVAAPARGGRGCVSAPARPVARAARDTAGRLPDHHLGGRPSRLSGVRVRGPAHTGARP